MSTTVLLFWEEVPETSKFFIIPDAPPWLLECHNLYINSTGLTPGQAKVMDILCCAITPHLDHCLEEMREHHLATTWAECEVDADLPFEVEGPVVVVKCGFFI